MVNVVGGPGTMLPLSMLRLHGFIHVAIITKRPGKLGEVADSLEYVVYPASIYPAGYCPVVAYLTANAKSLFIIGVYARETRYEAE